MKQVGSWFKENWQVITIIVGWFGFVTFMALKFGI